MLVRYPTKLQVLCHWKLGKKWPSRLWEVVFMPALLYLSDLSLFSKGYWHGRLDSSLLALGASYDSSHFLVEEGELE